MVLTPKRVHEERTLHKTAEALRLFVCRAHAIRAQYVSNVQLLVNPWIIVDGLSCAYAPDQRNRLTWLWNIEQYVVYIVCVVVSCRVATIFLRLGAYLEFDSGSRSDQTVSRLITLVVPTNVNAAGLGLADWKLWYMTGKNERETRETVSKIWTRNLGHSFYRLRPKCCS